ncbi:DUF262 domain-containing protein [Coleofasciculus sp. FACHB-SPT36]|uniref:DUF262 domain-containing protein n=1 Tax=Cyanophyceae TaxID=3028117 RepID=UPI00168A6DAC|nr:DUF262 domain-containing protein [Coleofasciculus sp. FACHB-SPT36]MBD2539445.1 DUF262 domain-containing protein [Coleofasciculus sp. FACHB-SPT36]
MATIESQDLSIGKLFNDFYVVPSYQREYVWEKEHVTEFFQDIYGEFSSNDSGAVSEYFIGSIIVCVLPDGLYEVIDGQQRITTAYVVLCAIRDYLQEIKQDESIELLTSQIASTDIDEEGNNVFRYRVTLQYADSCGVLEKIAQKEDLNKIPNTSSAQNIKNAYEEIKKMLDSAFGQSHLDIPTIKKFYAYFTKNVVLVRVKTATLADALRVFATINNRGVNLDAIDLVKNLMFMETPKKEYDILKQKWKTMVDILFRAKENPMRFLRYFILARYENVEALKENGIYGWFSSKTNKTYYENNPIAFVDELLETAQAYVNFMDGKDIEGKKNRYLENIRNISSAVRMPLMILLSGRHLPKDCFVELCRQVENIFFAYLLTREPTSNFERRFTQWCSELRKVTQPVEFSNFITHHIQPEKQKVAARFELTFSKLEESSVPKSQLRYILAKLTQYVDESAYGSDGSIIDLKTYINNKQVEVEHILPQNPLSSIKDLFDKPKDIDSYIKRLGNLTLLEKTINASVVNKTFEEKKEAYTKSRLLLTRSIGEKVKIGKNTAVDRAVKELETFEIWNSKSIDRRQEMLTRLAKKIWDMP